MNHAMTIYWAGDLFDHKDLVGNVLLSRKVEEVSEGRYRVRLPQDSEANLSRGLEIRDNDYRMLFECDLLLANFDGYDLDSGTVAEFCFAKSIDMPAVLLRTDFRFSGDRSTCPDPWNLMCSNFPRTRVLAMHGMTELHKLKTTLPADADFITAYHTEIARRIVRELDVVVTLPPIFADRTALLNQYRNTLRTLGGSMDSLFPPEKLAALVNSKRAKGVYF